MQFMRLILELHNCYKEKLSTAHSLLMKITTAVLTGTNGCVKNLPNTSDSIRLTETIQIISHPLFSSFYMVFHSRKRFKSKWES